MTDWVSYGEEVRRLRELRGWSQSELGFRAGTSQSNIRDTENAAQKIGPHPATVRGIQDAFGAGPGEPGYQLTAKFVSQARADAIADGNDALTEIIQQVSEDRRQEIAEMIREYLDRPKDPSH